MTTILKPGLKGPLTVLAGGICIGLAPIGLRFGLDDLGPLAIGFWRFLFAAPVLLLLVFLIQKRWPARPNILIIAAGICFANATFIVGLGNLGVGFLAFIFLKEKLNATWFLAVAIAIAGAAALSLGGGAEGKGVLNGDLLSAAAAGFVSFYILLSKAARRSLSGLEAIFWLTVVELCVAAIWVMAMGENFLPENPSGLLVPLFLALVVQVGGQGLIIIGLGQTPAAIAGVLVVVQPVVATILSWALFDEPLTGLQLGGCLFILGAIWLAQQGRRQDETAKTIPEFQ